MRFCFKCSKVVEDDEMVENGFFEMCRSCAERYKAESPQREERELQQIKLDEQVNEERFRKAMEAIGRTNKG